MRRKGKDAWNAVEAKLAEMAQGELPPPVDGGGGLMAKGGPLTWLEIAGADQKFEKADGKIDGDTVIVSSPQTTSPEAVRYAWNNYPEGCNLYNGAGLPAAPFRTDHW